VSDPGDPPARRLPRTAPGANPAAFAPLDWVLLATPALLWGSSFALMEVGLRHLGPGLVTFLRIVFGAAALATVPAARSPIDPADRPRVALLGITWMALPFTLFPIAQQWISSSLAGMLNSAMPVLTVVVATLLTRRAPGRWQALGVAVGLVGVVAIGADGWRQGDTTALGVVLVVVAVSSYALSVNLAVPLQQRYGALPVLVRIQAVAVVATAPGAVVALPSSSWGVDSVAAVVALGVLGTGWAFVAMATLIGRVGATRGSITTYLVPVVAVVVGVVAFDERVPPSALVGTALVLAGAALASRAERPTATALSAPAGSAPPPP
jgi:drug/metabolite transporter (DMT)-like permease